MDKKKIVPAILVILIVGGISFYGGMKYQISKTPVRQGGGNFGNGQNGMNRGRGGMGGGSFINGEITAKDNSSITLKMRDNSTKIVFFSTSTSIGTTVAGTANDLVIGKFVSVGGQANATGVVTAQSIQVRPEGMGFGDRSTTSTQKN